MTKWISHRYGTGETLNMPAFSVEVFYAEKGEYKYRTGHHQSVGFKDFDEAKKAAVVFAEKLLKISLKMLKEAK